jgi:hypothetical protein
MVAGENVPALDVLAIDPPGEVDQQLLETALQETEIARAFAPGDLVHPPAGPRVHGRIHVAEIPLVGRNLSVRMHVPFAQHQLELGLRELGVDPRHRDHVKGEIPRGKPRVLPLVRH